MSTILKPQAGENALLRYWRLSLGLGLAVIAAVVLLLELLARTAERIDAVAGGIWQVGKTIANNTVHIPLLIRTNQIVGDISATADGIAGATTRIQRAVVGGGRKEAAP